MKKLIVTADDYGVIPSVNKGILNAVHQELVNSVAVFANYDGSGKNGEKKYPSSKENVETLLNRYGSKVDVGCHLTITSGKSITGRENIGFLVDEDNYFHDFKKITYVNSASAKEAIKAELIAQVKELEKVQGCKVKHLTNHHDSLTFFPAYYDAYLAAAAELKLPIRSPDIRPANKPRNYREIVRSLLIFTGQPKSVRKEVTDFGKIIRQYFIDTNDNVRTTSYMDSSHYGPAPILMKVKPIDLQNFTRKKNNALEEALSNFAQDEQAEIMELMLHLCDDDIAAINTYSDLDYPGIDPNYFGGRIAEFHSIMEFDFEASLRETQIEYARWDAAAVIPGGDNDLA
jgi:predicted glycoside hydrolase/deacetylase ChbG (UPF0249 family)